MNERDLKPASQLAQKYGVKSIIYGKPGSGKTPLIATAPRPLLLATEAGLLSLRQSNVPAYQAHTSDKISEFFTWFFNSAEARNYDTLAIDSGSQLAEIVLTDQLKRNKDGRKAYGEMSRIVMEWFDALYFMERKHIVLNCKLANVEVGKTIVRDGGGFSVDIIRQVQPYFPGNDLNIKVPHRYDQILYLDRIAVPGQIKPIPGLRTEGTAEILARDRSGNLSEIEPADLTSLFAKAMI